MIFLAVVDPGRKEAEPRRDAGRKTAPGQPTFEPLSAPRRPDTKQRSGRVRRQEGESGVFLNI